MITPAAASTLTVTGLSGAVAGTAQTVVVTAYDQYGNVATGYTGTLHFTTSDTFGTTVLPADYSFQAGDNGTHTFINGVRLTKVGTQSVTATDTVTNTITNIQGGLVITPAAASTLTVTGLSGAVAGTVQTVVVTAKDLYGNLATGYTGTIHFTTSDTFGTTSVPVNYNFQAGDNGTHTFNNGVTLTKVGTQSVTATDTVTNTITGNQGGLVTTPAAPWTEIVSGTTGVMTITNFDVYTNQINTSNNNLSIPGSNGIYHDLIINLNSGNTAVIGGNISITGTLKINSGSTFDPGLHTVASNTLDLYGALLVDAANFAANFTFTSKILETSSTINYAASGDQTVNYQLSYYNLIVSGSGNKTLDGNVLVGGNLTVGSGTNLNGAYNLNITGNAVFNGTAGVSILLSKIYVSGTTLINSGSISTSGTQEYNATTTLFSDVTLTGNGITFDSTIDSNNALTPRSLTISDSGTTVFDGLVGAGAALNILSVTSNAIQISAGSDLHSASIKLTVPGIIDTGAGLIADKLDLNGTGNFTLTGSSNAVGTLRANITGSLTFSQAGSLKVDSVSAGGATSTVILTTTGSGDLTLGSIIAGSSITVNSAHDILAEVLGGVDQSLLVANTVNLTAGNNIGSSAANSDIVTLSGALNVTATTGTGNVYLDSTGAGLEINLAANGLADLITNDVILDTITTGGNFVLNALNGNVTLNGTIKSTGGAVDLQSSNGSINGNPGSVVVANADSLFSTPNGTIGLTNPVNVNITGNLFLDIGTSSVGLKSGYLLGTVSSVSGIPLFSPSSLPSPLIPPGNVYFNGNRIWPNTSTLVTSQSTAQASSALPNNFTLPSSESLTLTQVNSFNPGQAALFLYHPLIEIDSVAFDQQFQLDEGAFDFIDGQIQKKLL